MPFTSRETDMAYFPFDHCSDYTSSPDTHYPSNYSTTPQSYATSPLFDDYSVNSSSLGSINADAFGLSHSNSHHMELAKITEYETWSMSQPANMQTSVQDPTPPYTATMSSYQQDTHPSPPPKTEYTSRRRAPLSRANSGSGKTLSRPGSSQSSFPPKKRMSTPSTPATSPPTPISDLGLPVEEAKTPPKAKTPSKISHSITERRYRENLKSKLVQLDQTLSSTRNLKGQAQNPETEDEQNTEVPVKTRKADVLNEAMRYIKQAEHDGEARDKEIDFLRLRLAALEKLVNCGDCALLRQFADQQMNFSTDF